MIQANPTAELIHKTAYKKVFFDSEAKVLIKYWLSSSEYLDETTFMNEMVKWAELVKNHKPIGELVVALDFKFAISPKMQAWVSKDIFKVYYKSGLKYAAFVSSLDLISQLSVEQAMDENYGKYLSKGYFKTFETAYSWLKTKITK